MTDIDFASMAPAQYDGWEYAEADAADAEAVLSDEADEAAEAAAISNEIEDTSASVEPEAVSSPVEAPEAPAAPKARKTRKNPAKAAPAPADDTRTRQRGGAADFGGARQAADSATNAAKLFARLLVDGSVKINIDGEVSGLLKTDTPAITAHGADRDKVRKATTNRIHNRLLASGRFGDEGDRKGALKVERVNAQTILVTLLRTPGYRTPTGRLSVPGKVAAALVADGKTLCPIAAAGLDSLEEAE